MGIGGTMSEDKGSYIIRFSSDKIYIDGKPLQEAIETEFNRNMSVKIANNQIPNNAADREALEKSVRYIAESNMMSKRQIEKDILESLVSKAMADEKKQSAWNVLNSIVDDIQNADEFVEIDKRYWKQINDSFEKFKPEEKEKMFFFWRKCKELFKQLEVPEEKKI